MVDQISPYIFKKRRVYYFSRRVPSDLKNHYKHPRIVLSLRTRSLSAAKLRATSMAAKLEEDWMVLRWRTSDDPLSRFLFGQGTWEYYHLLCTFPVCCEGPVPESQG